MPQFDNLLKACCNHRGGEPDKNLIQTSRDLVLRAEQDITILGKAAAHLPTLPPEGAAWLAAVFAATIERGEGVEQSAPAVTDLFLSWLTKRTRSPRQVMLSQTEATDILRNSTR